MRTSENITEIAKALVSMQGEMQIASKDSKGYNYKYSDLVSVWSVIREPLQKNGLFVTQEASTHGDTVGVTTRILHMSGQWIENETLIIPMSGKNDAQSTGSAITYARRYQLCAVLGVVSEEDDDGVAAKKNAPKSHKAVEKTDRIISKNSFDSLELTINGYEDLRKDLKKLCEVSDLRNIKSSQWNSVKNYVETFITKVNKSKQEQEK